MSGMTSRLNGGAQPLAGGKQPGMGLGDAAALMARPAQPDIWYREPWLLLVVGGPALVVVACAVTLYLAISRPDPLVSKDYYRDGLRINQTMAAEEAARKLVLRSRPASANSIAPVAGANAEGRQK